MTRALHMNDLRQLKNRLSHTEGERDHWLNVADDSLHREHELEARLQSREEQLETAITALRVVGDYAFGTWDDDAARLAAGREGEALTRAVLAGSNPASKPLAPPKDPSNRMDKRGRLVSNQESSP